MALKHEHASASLGELAEAATGPHPRSSNSVGLEQGTRLAISHKFLDAADMLDKHLSLWREVINSVLKSQSWD